ncbi:MAG: hypothetical protein HOE90_14835 [Bacteriovoracaceae bacterium]|jgi:hypothetical protein|nr:hypothetical protein [Bacteriovoracaceae bacterium]
MIKSRMSLRAKFIYLFGFFFIAIFSHLLFSHLGFVVSDHGNSLAITKRLLLGQIPHLDFISTTPVFSHFLWIPLLKFGGDSIFLWERFIVWIEYVFLSWLWVSIFKNLFNLSLTILREWLILIVSFTFTANVMPLMSTSYVDAFMLCSLGIYLRIFYPKNGIWGYGLIALSVLSKLSFIGVFPILLVLNKDYKRPTSFVAFFTPILCYAFYLSSHGAMSESIQQIFYTDNFLDIGLLSTIVNKSFYRGLIPGLFWLVIANFVCKKYANARQERYRYFEIDSILHNIKTLIIVVFFSYGFLVYFQEKFTYKFPLALFGFVVGHFVYKVFNGGFENKKFTLASLLTIYCSWSILYNETYNTPAFASGMNALYVLFVYLHEEAIMVNFKKYTHRTNKFLVTLMVFGISVWTFVRGHYIYGELERVKLKHSLSQILPGARGILTNEKNAMALTELKFLAGKYQSGGFTIFPNYGGFWVGSSLLNSQSIDHFGAHLLKREHILSRLLSELNSLPKESVVFLENYDSASFSHDKKLIPAKENQYSDAVLSNFREIEKTSYFTVYKSR